MNVNVAVSRLVLKLFVNVIPVMVSTPEYAAGIFYASVVESLATSL